MFKMWVFSLVKLHVPYQESVCKNDIFLKDYIQGIIPEDLV